VPVHVEHLHAQVLRLARDLEELHGIVIAAADAIEHLDAPQAGSAAATPQAA
jgi:hypothetical protein